MNNILQFIWWVIFLGPMFKTMNMIRFIYSINADKAIKLPKKIKNYILVFITIIALFVGAELTLHGLTLTAYILIIVAVFFVWLLLSDFFNKKSMYILLVWFPISAFIGRWTGILALEAKSPFYLELIIITIIFILPYIQYRLIFKKEKLIEYIDDYLIYIQNQKFQDDEILKFTTHLKNFKTLYKDYVNSCSKLKKLEKELSLKILRDPKHTSIFENKSYSEIKTRFKTVDRITSLFSEILSILTGGLSIAGSSEESVVKSIGHFNDYLHNPEKKHFLRMTYVESTKGKTDILDKLLNNNYLIFYLKYVAKSDDYSDCYSSLANVANEFKEAWIERDKFTKLSEFQKRAIQEGVKKIIEMKSKMTNEGDNGPNKINQNNIAPKEQAKKKRSSLNNFDSRYKLCAMILFITLLSYLIVTLLYDTLKSYMSGLGLTFTVLILIMALYFLYGLFLSPKLFTANSIVYLVFPILYLITFWAKLEFNQVNGWIFNGIIIILLIIHTIVTFKLKNLDARIKPTVIILISLIIFLTVSALIVDFTNEEKHLLGLKLNDCKTSKQFKDAEILCKNQLGNTVVDSKVTCELKNIKLFNISGAFRFTLLNGTPTLQKFSNGIYFVVPEKVGNIYIQFNAIYNGKKRCFSSGISQTFATWEQYKQNKKDFATYLAALIGFVLVSVPLIYKNWKEVFIK